MRYLIHSITGYEHLAKKFKQAVLMHVEQDGSEMARSVQSFFVR